MWRETGKTGNGFLICWIFLSPERAQAAALPSLQGGDHKDAHNVCASLPSALRCHLWPIATPTQTFRIEALTFADISELLQYITEAKICLEKKKRSLSFRARRAGFQCRGGNKVQDALPPPPSSTRGMTAVNVGLPVIIHKKSPFLMLNKCTTLRGERQAWAVGAEVRKGSCSLSGRRQEHKMGRREAQPRPGSAEARSQSKAQERKHLSLTGSDVFWSSDSISQQAWCLKPWCTRWIACGTGTACCMGCIPWEKELENLEKSLIGGFGGFSRARISFLMEIGALAKALQPPRALQWEVPVGKLSAGKHHFMRTRALPV